MKPLRPRHLYFWLFFPFIASLAQAQQRDTLAVVAFMPDIHFHDVFAGFEDPAFPGLPSTWKGEPRFATIRTMESQLKSTRLFNENYFAFLAALDDAAQRGITWIALPGDFSDNGQSIHLKGLKEVLQDYEARHGMRFFAAPGNHDPTTPYRSPAGQTDFLGAGGRPLPVFSTDHPVCTRQLPLNYPEGIQPHPVICTDEAAELGYEGVFEWMKTFGFMPDSSLIYFETPYSQYPGGVYSLDSAQAQSALHRRQYEICLQGTGGHFKQGHYSHCYEVADLSYLTEPVAGLWLLAIDANVYLPRAAADTHAPASAAHFEGSGSAGYNRMLTHKQHVVEWMEDVARRADSLGKTLVAFSHFPMTEYYDGAARAVPDLFGKPNAFQLRRMPSQATSQALAQTGLRLHFGGHMHQNDTGVITDSASGNTLVNVQAPSLAAYKPAYKLLYLFKDQTAEVETIVINEVPGFDVLFPHYQTEWKYLDTVGYAGNRNKAILSSKSYSEYTRWHIAELTRLRFLPEEWPAALRDSLPQITGWEILLRAMASQPKPEAKALRWIKRQGLRAADLSWTGLDLAIDFYRVQNADELSFADISPERRQQYQALHRAFEAMPTGPESPELTRRLRAMFGLLNQFMNGEPSDHFFIDLKNGQLQRLEPR